MQVNVWRRVNTWVAGSAPNGEGVNVWRRVNTWVAEEDGLGLADYHFRRADRAKRQKQEEELVLILAMTLPDI